MKRYSIMVVEQNSDRETELCQVESDPQVIAQAALGKKLHIDRGGKRRVSIPKYTAVRVRDNQIARAV